jgi:peptide-methionine (S)-S-oxide reductase
MILEHNTGEKQQFSDVRSAIFYHDDEQKTIAEKVRDETQLSVSSKIVTEISPASTFYVAENYHQDYFNLNPNQGYCQAVVKPKVEKFKKIFLSKLK